ncbi:biotin synthase BioB [Verrucomicrobia bacterium]|nr:biotin synthase BioB [Verrucomicrobiota bacterium]
MVDVTNRDRIHALADRIMAGGSVDRDEALWMFHLESQADITDLMSAANRLREHFKGNKIHLCSIVNAKAGGCSENCKFCSQSAAYTTESPRYGFIDPEPVSEASKEAEQNNVTAVGLVAAWKGLREGPVLDEVCDRIREMAADGKVRPDASLGLIDSQQVADRLKDAGLACYGHNLESSRRFFPEHCTTHTFEDRLQTIKYLKNAGIKICSGGIIGMGETREDRCDMAMQLREIGASVVPVNFLNPIEGTPYETMKPLAPMEILKTIACFRFILPQQEIMVAGGRTVNLRDLQSMVFMAGASALMVGNYLTTLNQPAEQDLQMLKDLGLDPDWEPHEDMESDGCGSNDACGCASKEEPVTA